MENTSEMNLIITTEATFDSDDIKDTIVGYGENFKKIEKHLTEKTNSPELLAVGQYFSKGKMILNQNPNIGDYVGWVNTRNGLHAPSWTPKTNYTIGATIKANPDNGFVYQCVTAGRSMFNNPVFLQGDGVEFYDANGNNWIESYNYQVNDVVFATNGSKLFYYICETAGISDVSEPSWSSINSGTTVIDGSVVWRKEANIKWKQIDNACDFRPFGKIE